MIAYDATNFWGVVFARLGSSFPAVIPRTIFFLFPAVSALILYELYPKAMAAGKADLELPFQMLVAIMTTFRLVDAFRKFETAASTMLQLHSESRKILNRLCAGTPDTEEVYVALEKIRRLMVLSAVLIKKHVSATEKPQPRRSGRWG